MTNKPLIDNKEAPAGNALSRRKFITGAGGLAASSLLGAAALVTGSDDEQAQIEWAEHFQKHYRLTSDDEKSAAIERLERRYSKQYKQDVSVDTTDAEEGVLFGYALNLQKCIGCRRCVKACVVENNQSRGDAQETEWIRVIKMEKGQFEPEKMNQGYPNNYGLQVGGNAYGSVGVVLEGEHYYQPDAVCR